MIYLGDIWNNSEEERRRQALDTNHFAACWVLYYMYLPRPVTARFVKELNTKLLLKCQGFARLSGGSALEIAVALGREEVPDKVSRAIREVNELFAQASAAYEEARLAAMMLDLDKEEEGGAA